MSKRVRDGNVETGKGRGRASKRPRMSEEANGSGSHLSRGVSLPDTDPAAYKIGSIWRLKMVGFLTYDCCEVFPGPRLNVVMGPNGTGKSTLVCAIAIGLGANIKVLGRGAHEHDFIKHGASFAELEVELKGPPETGNLVVYHKISRTHRPEWRIGTKDPHHPFRMERATAEEVRERVKQYNIQIDNLCQFLPQDRVSAFANMDEKALLRETLKAVGKGDNLYSELDELVEDQKGIDQLAHSIEQEEKKLKDDKEQNKTLQVDVERYKDRCRQLEIVRLCKLKRPWVEYEMAKQISEEAKRECTEVEKKIQEAQRLLAPLKKRVAQEKKEMESAVQHEARVAKRMRSELSRQESFFGDFDEYEAKIAQLRDQIGLLQNREEDRLKEARRLEHSIRSKKEALDALPQTDVTKKKIEKFKTQISVINKKIDEQLEIRRKFEEEMRHTRSKEKEVREKIKYLQDERANRMKMLRENDGPAFNAYKWIQSNKDKFQKDVLGPVILDVSVPNPKHAICFEKAIPRYLLMGFVCQCEFDELVIQRELITHQKLAISVVSLRKIIEAPPRRVPMQYLHEKYGVDCWMDETWDAHPSVKKAILANVPSMYHTAVGSQKTGQMIDEFMKDERCKNLGKVYTDEMYYDRIFSRYSGAPSTRVESLPKRSRYIRSVDLTLLKELTTQLETVLDSASALKKKVQGVMERESAFQQELGTLKQKKKNEEQSIRHRRDLENHISAATQELGNLRLEEDTSVEIERTEKEISKVIGNQLKLAEKLLSATAKLSLSEKEKIQWRLKEMEHSAKMRAWHEEEKRKMNEQSGLMAEKSRVQQNYQEKKRISDRKQQIAIEESGFITGETRQKFETIPDDLAELDAVCSNAQSKAQVNTQTDGSILAEYEKRTNDIDQLERSLESKNERLGDLHHQTKKKREEWMEAVKENIDRIDDGFRDYMHTIGCEGAIVLHAPEDKFDEFGIKIMVQFRKPGKLQHLKGMTQSGGEKSVATMLYLVSLQPLTPCPFRLVDEINQGMDARNERMIFEQVVNSACRGDGQEIPPQYFLITPKLLPDLKFEKHMRVLCVLNGPFQQHLKSWLLSDISQASGPGFCGDE